MVHAPASKDAIEVAKQAARIIRDYLLDTGQAGDYDLPKHYDHLVLQLETAGLLVETLRECIYCESKCRPQWDVCRFHHSLSSRDYPRRMI